MREFQPSLLAHASEEPEQVVAPRPWFAYHGKASRAYSGDLVDEGRIRKPLKIGGELFTVTGRVVQGNKTLRTEAYRLVDPAEHPRQVFEAGHHSLKAQHPAVQARAELSEADASWLAFLATPYSEGGGGDDEGEDFGFNYEEDSAWCRADPYGFYDGMTVSYGGVTYAMLGPELRLVEDDSPEAPNQQPLL